MRRVARWARRRHRTRNRSPPRGRDPTSPDSVPQPLMRDQPVPNRLSLSLPPNVTPHPLVAGCGSRGRPDQTEPARALLYFRSGRPQSRARLSGRVDPAGWRDSPQHVDGRRGPGPLRCLTQAVRRGQHQVSSGRPPRPVAATLVDDPPRRAVVSGPFGCVVRSGRFGTLDDGRPVRSLRIGGS